jgi:geranylgeranyl diphosphate synthase type I
MDTFALTLDYLLNLSLVQTWPEMQALVKRAVAKQDRNWGLPVVTCEAVGGRTEQAVPAVAAIGCLQISIILIDDLLDSDPRGEYNRIGAPAAANLAAAFQALSLEAIAQSKTEPAARLAALESLNRAALQTALGQQLDAQNPSDEATYWKVAQMKSSPFCIAAFHLGALVGGASLELAEKLKGLGDLYGEMIQIQDDLHDVMAVPANPDWTLGRSPLPILFAQTVDHPDKARFLELRGAVSDPEVLTEAQTILIRCGAVSYGVHQILRRYERAREMLRGIPLSQPERLEALLEDQVKPVRELFASLGAPEPKGLKPTTPGSKE